MNECEMCHAQSETVTNHVDHLDRNAAATCRACYLGWLDGRTPEQALAEESGDESETEPYATDEQIEALGVEAASAGDLEQVMICERALRGELNDRAECSRVIAAARAMID